MDRNNTENTDNFLDQVDKTDNLQFVVFNIGKEKYGIEISKIREIVKIEKQEDITRVPGVPDYIEGIINVRGEVTAVINMRRRLGFPDFPDKPVQDKPSESGTDIGKMAESKVIIVEHDETEVGLLVDDVRDVKYVSEGEIDTVPPMISKQKGGKFLRGIGKTKDDLILLIDLDKVFSLDEPYT